MLGYKCYNILRNWLLDKLSELILNETHKLNNWWDSCCFSLIRNITRILSPSPSSPNWLITLLQVLLCAWYISLLLRLSLSLPFCRELQISEFFLFYLFIYLFDILTGQGLGRYRRGCIGSKTDWVNQSPSSWTRHNQRRPCGPNRKVGWLSRCPMFMHDIYLMARSESWVWFLINVNARYDLLSFVLAGTWFMEVIAPKMASVK